ncbi:hypothetical protein [Mangrovicoccus sp. HB161399]|uniref:hypothetical protein n=1 Tax=Mangrovicoccus sp. HB161399 TaxID=2720392 RepID=UPI0015559B07|nr:hypothetical protein [Mangrovicoccus sp. HB161399]
MSGRLKGSPAAGAMRTALQNRRPAPGPVFHSGRGIQHAAGDCRRLLEAWKVGAAMSGTGDCLEFKPVRANGPDDPGDRSKAPNAPMEGFFGSLVAELVRRARFRSRREARAALSGCIAIFCSRQRRHPSTGCRRPEQAGIGMAAAMAEW